MRLLGEISAIGQRILPTITNTGLEVTTGCLVGSISMTPSFNDFWISYSFFLKLDQPVIQSSKPFEPSPFIIISNRPEGKGKVSPRKEVQKGLFRRRRMSIHKDVSLRGFQKYTSLLYRQAHALPWKHPNECPIEFTRDILILTSWDQDKDHPQISPGGMKFHRFVPKRRSDGAPASRKHIRYSQPRRYPTRFCPERRERTMLLIFFIRHH